MKWHTNFLFLKIFFNTNTSPYQFFCDYCCQECLILLRLPPDPLPPPRPEICYATCVDFWILNRWNRNRTKLYALSRWCFLVNETWYRCTRVNKTLLYLLLYENNQLCSGNSSSHHCATGSLDTVIIMSMEGPHKTIVRMCVCVICFFDYTNCLCLKKRVKSPSSLSKFTDFLKQVKFLGGILGQLYDMNWVLITPVQPECVCFAGMMTNKCPRLFSAIRFSSVLFV